jgi:magnesium transporter
LKIIDIENNFMNVVKEVNLKSNYYWILANTNEIEKLDEFITIDSESMKDCKEFSKSAKISFFNEYTFAIFNVLSYVDNIIVSKELYVFLSKKYIITVYRDTMNILNELITDIKESKNCFILKDKPQVDILLYYILDRIIIRNYDIISELETQVDRIEISILKSPEKEQLYNLITLRRQVYKIRKYLNPLRHIGDSLNLNDNFIIEKDSLKYFIGINKKIEKLIGAVESLVQDLAMVREAFESEAANKTNELMKIFTVVTSIFMPLNLITSMYSMQLNGTPFINVKNGYHYVIMLMVLIAFILIMIFRKKKWI